MLTTFSTLFSRVCSLGFPFLHNAAEARSSSSEVVPFLFFIRANDAARWLSYKYRAGDELLPGMMHPLVCFCHVRPPRKVTLTLTTDTHPFSFSDRPVLLPEVLFLNQRQCG